MKNKVNWQGKMAGMCNICPGVGEAYCIQVACAAFLMAKC